MTTFKSEPVTIDVDDGTKMIVHVTRPASAAGSPPGILVFHEAFGANDWLRTVCARLAALGFVALAPEFYHRQGDGIVGAYDAGHEFIAQYAMGVDAATTSADIRAAYKHLVEAEGADTRRIATVGFCMGGRTTYMANATVPIAAGVSYYGGNIPRWFDYLDKQRAPLLFFWGRRDVTVSTEQARLVEDKLAEAGANATHVTFPNAQHAFFRDVDPRVYDPVASRLAWPLTLEFFRENGVLAS